MRQSKETLTYNSNVLQIPSELSQEQDEDDEESEEEVAVEETLEVNGK